jgi:hypothetical protein
MTELHEIDTNTVWLSKRYWRRESETVHTDRDCDLLGKSDNPRGPVDPAVLHDDMSVCKRCDPTEPDRYGGSGTSLAYRLRHGDLKDATLDGGGST